MIDDPGLDRRELSEAIRHAWAVEATAFTFVPGYDMTAASFEVASYGDRWFLKVRMAPLSDAGLVSLEVPRALVDGGVANVVAPLMTHAGEVAHPLGADRSCELYPFIAGQSAMRAGSTEVQWLEFGRTLRAVHDSDVATAFEARLPVERFDLPFLPAVHSALRSADQRSWTAPSQLRLVALLRRHRSEIETMLERAEELGARLSRRPVEHVLCHADIHAANIVATDDDGIVLVDWDGPRLAPRERDLLFVIGSRIAREVTPVEEGWFFEGYGAVAVDPEMLIYFRYERILEDLGAVGSSVFDSMSLSEVSRAGEVDLAEALFGLGSIVETAELVDLSRAG